MTTPTTLPEALTEIEELRGQVHELLGLLGQEVPRDTGAAGLSTTEITGLNDPPEISFAPVSFQRKQTEHERIQTLAELRNVIETVPDVIFRLDLRGNLAGWNKRLETVTGFVPGELKGRPALSFVPECEHERTAAAILRAFEEGYAELEGHLLTKDQRAIPYHWTGAVLKSDEGQVIGITGVGRDVSEKKRIEAELRRQQQHLLAAQAMAHVGSWDWDIVSGAMEWSEEQFRIFGYEPKAIPVTYEAFIAALHPDDHDCVVASINDTLEGKTSLDVECRVVRPDGEIRTIHYLGRIIRSEDSSPVRLSGSTLDITDRKQAESALQQSELHFRAMIENSSDIITVLDLDGTIRFESPSFERLLGYAQHEIDGRIAFDFVHPDDLPTVIEKFQRIVLQPGEAQTAEFRFRHQDGSWRSLEGVGRATCDSKSRSCVIVNSRDITERKRAEQSLLQTRDLLTSFVENTPAAVAMLDRELRYVAVSRRWLNDYRLGDKPLVGRRHYDVFPEIQDMKEWQEIHQRCLSGSVERREEDRFVRADGSEDWLRWEVRPWHDITGEIGGIIMFTEVITERKRAEEALRASEERFVAAVEGSTDVLWDAHRIPGAPWHEPNTPIWWSPRVRQLLCLEDRERFDTLGQWVSRLHPDDMNHVLGKLAAHIEERIPYDVEYRIRTNRGEYRWLRGRGQAIWDGQGEPRRMSGSCQDITDRKQADDALRKSEQRFHFAVEATSDGIWDWDIRTGVVYFSPQWMRLLGYSSDDVVPSTEFVFSLLHPDDQARTAQVFQEHLDGRIPVKQLEIRLRQKSGDYRWYLDRGKVVARDQDGRPLRMVGTITDITERKQVQEALEASEERYARATAVGRVGVWEGVWELDALQGLFSADENLKALLGYAKEELSTDPLIWLDLVHPDDRATALEAWNQVSKGLVDSYSYEVRMIRKDGSIIWTHVRGHANRNKTGNVVQLIGATVDITDRKRTDERLLLTQFSIDRASDAVLWMDSGACILNVNDAACRMLEYTREELTAMTVHDIDPNFPPEVWPAHWDELKRKGSLTFEAKHWSRTGRVQETEVTVNYLQYEGREYNCAIMRDIGERKRAEAQLRQSHDFIRQVIDVDPNFIFAKDRDGRFTLVNKAVAECYGTTVDELIGKSDEDFNPNVQEVAFFRRLDLDVMDSLHERFIPEEKITDSTGRIRWLQTVKRPIFDDQGRAVMVLGAATDITERKRMEAELRQRERDLRAAVEERERISEDLHDGILQSIFAVGLGLESCRTLVSELPLPRKKTTAPLMAALNSAIGQLNHVMTDVRNFIAGIESQVLQGGDVGSTFRAMVQAMCTSNGTPCRVMIEEAAVGELSTEQALHVMNVMREALSNGLRHSGAGRISLTFTRLRRSLRLSVTDNGKGFIPDSVRDVGHGLANMTARARKLGGRVEVRSWPRKGTKVLLDLPRRSADE
jgi:PAS domain S-box-containing protein